MIALVFSLTLLVVLFILDKDTTGKEMNPPEKLPYTHTKAICDEKNYCQDYEIECQGKQVIRMSPITGAFFQQSSEWQDPRDEKTRNVLCN